MLSALKSLIYRGSRISGFNAALFRSSWRTRRLLILCYHGISLEDEHEWCGMYMSPATFRERLERIQEAGCNVLPLGTALERLKSGDLPPRAVAITFDDGFYDFYAVARPLLRKFQYPVTVYLTSYYSEYNVPVFDLMCPYLLWKARGQEFRWPEMNIEPVSLDAASAFPVTAKIRAECRKRNLTWPQLDGLLRDLACRLGMDDAELRRKRILHIMTPEEAAELARQGVDFQLHGHWHRVSHSRERFWSELSENQRYMAGIGVASPAHYCYPAGTYLPEFPSWLAELGVRSATTCHMGFATTDSDAYGLPRLVDTPSISADEFSAWLSGLASWMPRRQYPSTVNQFVEPEEEAIDAKPAPAGG